MKFCHQYKTSANTIKNTKKEYKKSLTRKQPNESKHFENFDSKNGNITIKEIKQTITKLKNEKGSRK